MNNKDLKVSIGIPAYNEEANIYNLIASILKQEQMGYKLCEIIIVADGCTDETVNIIKSFDNPIIKIIELKKRQGQQICQNHILSEYKGNILVIIEADTLPYNKNCISELIKPFVKNKENKLGMVTGCSMATTPKTFLEKILFQGYEIKKKIFQEWKNGKNIYVCGGHSMKALSRNFTKNLHWPKNSPEDAYTYLCLTELGLKMERQLSAKTYMRNTTNLPDRIRQVSKFLSGRDILRKYFSNNLIDREYDLPKSLIIKNIFLELMNNPIWTLLYIFEISINRFILLTRIKKFNPLYKPYLSSKELGYKKHFLTDKKLTVSIGIPAYNEEKNIKILLKNLQKQIIYLGEIIEMIVISDGSSDKTVSTVKSIKDKRIKIINRKKRLGMNQTLNEIVTKAKGDVLILLNADIIPQNKEFLENIALPIVKNNKVGIVSADTISTKPQGLFEKIITDSHNLKKDIYLKINQGNNILMCHGRARAFSRKIYSQIIWPDNYPEDSFSYLFCIQKGFKFVYAPKAKVLFRSPATFLDHLKQSQRFLRGVENLQEYFTKEKVAECYRIPKLLMLKSIVKFIVTKPFSTLVYLFIYILIKFSIPMKYVNQSKFDIALTSKELT